MHNVLSYQTAMRVNSGGEIDVRQFVTKRSCVSIVLSVAFLTLISGFIFGKFDSHRHQQNKLLHESKELQLQKELHTIKITLASAAGEAMANNTIDDATSLNHQIYINLQTCLQATDNSEFNVKLDVFLVKLVDREINKLLQCFINIGSFLKNIDVL